MILDGWDAIAAHMTKLTGVARTRVTLWRWAKKRLDPLPVSRTPGGRDVVASSEAIDAWWDRQLVSCAEDETRKKLVSVVYFARDGEFIKIGFSSVAASRRIDDLQCGNPRPISLIGEVPGDRELESNLHQRFSGLRVRREWFRAEPELLEHIDSLIRGHRVSGE